MAEIEAAFAGLPVISVYTAQPPEGSVPDEAEMRHRRPAEGRPEAAGKEVN